MNSSGAGTNMLTVLGAESKLVFVGPAEEGVIKIKKQQAFGEIRLLGAAAATDPSPRC